MIDLLTELAVVHLWQVTVAFIIVWSIGNLTFAKRRPHLMLLLWVLFFVKCVVPPVIQSPVSPMANLTPGGLAESIDLERRFSVSEATAASVGASGQHSFDQS